MIDEIYHDGLNPYVSVGGMRVNNTSIPMETNIRVRVIGEIKKSEGFCSEISDFSNIELLEELEKRTAIEID